MRFLRTALTLVTAACAFAPGVRAQDAFDAPPPYLSMVEGAATLDRPDGVEPATRGVPLVFGDRVRTDRGRAEILFPDGSAIDLDEFTTLELEGPTLFQLTSGRILIVAAGVANPAAALQFQIDTPVASAQTDGPGEYRVSIVGGPSGLQTEMAILRGAGALVNDFGTMPLRSGERSLAWDNAPPTQPQFNAARFDAFDQWAMALRDQRLGVRAQSAQYLPTDLRMYGGDFDRYGSWNYEAPYGYVWYPTVAPDWRPYYNGYWTSVPTYGWTWIGLDVWSWPTHHYGRWGYGRSRWFWIPDRRWSPAWVSWGGAPGYVSWCPLGFDNLPVFALSISTGGGGWRGDGWRGWTVVSRDHFGGRRNVHQYAVGPRSLPANVGFVAERSAPVAPAMAVPRRAFGNDRQIAGNRQFPNVVGRSSNTQGNSATRRSTGGDRVAEGQQPPRTDRPNVISRSPQAVSRQPQTMYGQASGQPRVDPGVIDNRPRAVMRQPQAPYTQAPQSGSPSYDPQSRAPMRTRPPDVRATTPAQNPYDNRVYSARPRYERPSAPVAPVQPTVPTSPERPQYGTAVRRAEPIRPVQPVQPAPPETPRPGFSRRADGPIYSQRPAPPMPAAAPPQTPQRSEPPAAREAAPPRQEQSQGQARARETQQSSGSDRQQNGGGNSGHHRR